MDFFAFSNYKIMEFVMTQLFLKSGSAEIFSHSNINEALRIPGVTDNFSVFILTEVGSPWQWKVMSQTNRPLFSLLPWIWKSLARTIKGIIFQTPDKEVNVVMNYFS